MKRSAYRMKKVFSRGMACLLAAVMLLSASGTPGALADSDELLPESETPAVSEVTERSTDSLTMEETPDKGLASETVAEDGTVEAADTSVTYEDEADWLNGTNWMSGISDDRYLHEINIPGTHDSGCSDVWGAHGYTNEMADKAITQNLTIFEQLNAGVRLLDLRWTNCISNIKHAAADDLFENHGGYQFADLDFLYYCVEDSRYRRFEDVMDDIERFLWDHPTETVILNMQSEYDDTKRYGSQLRRDLEKIETALENGTEDSLPDYLKEAADYYKAELMVLKKMHVITYEDLRGPHARTGTYIYSHNYSVFATMKPKLERYSDILYTGSKVPALGEVRGKAVLVVKDSDNILGCGINIGCGNKIATVSAGGVDFAYQNCWDKGGWDKAMEIYEFLDKYNTQLPEAGEHTTRGYINYSSSSTISSNPKDISGWPNKLLYMPEGQELEEMESALTRLNQANPWLKQEYSNFGQLGMLRERGRHFGWVYSDFVTEDMASMLWHTNFPSGVKSITVTYKNGEEVVGTRKVPSGGVSEVDPERFNPDVPEPGYELTGWKNVETGTVYQPGDRTTFEKDTELQAQWGMTWKSLATAIWNTGMLTPGSFKLPSDLVAEDDDEEITIWSSSPFRSGTQNLPVGADITIDLNGHTIDANAKEGEQARRIFRVPTGSTLHIIDSSGSGAGMLTGGCEENGGAILVELGGELSLENVTFKGNHAESRGGAIYSRALSLNLRNTAITGNTAGEAGAGFFYAHKGNLEMQGSVLLQGNTLKGVSNPLLEGAESNIYLDNTLQNDSSAGFITVSGPLEPESVIGVSLARGPAIGEEQVITCGLNGNGSVNSFLSDLNKYEVLNQDGEVAFLGKLQTMDYDPNGATSGSVPMDPKTYNDGDTATVLGNTGNLLRTGFGFIGWNTEADGSGTAYSEGDTITIEGPVTLYAQWAAASVTTQAGASTVYGTFQEALDAWEWNAGSTMTLLGDVTTEETINAPVSGLTLDLNGFGITRLPRTETEQGRNVMMVNINGNLTLKDSAPDRTDTGENRPEGVTGGYLTGGYAHGTTDGQFGGGVLVKGTLNMEGGTIAGNSALSEGGGVYVLGTFRMSGGAITGNTASFVAGVYVSPSAAFAVSGSARIENNIADGSQSNVFLCAGKTITVDGLDSDASIGVWMETAGTFTEGAAFADDMTAQAVFTTDLNEYIVRRTDDGQAMLWQNTAVNYISHTAEAGAASAETKTCGGYTLLISGTHEESITLSSGWYVVMNEVTAEKRITVSGTANLILCDGAVLNAMEGINVGAEDTLNIYPGSTGDSVQETGRLKAGPDGGKYQCAGIGGYDSQGGTVAIHGGVVTATGGKYAAGIGGSAASGGTVTIYGGTVDARGGQSGAGIGGGLYGTGGTVTIYDGAVNAWGGRYGAGIGGANAACGNVTVYGGTVNAYGGPLAAGIGGGYDAEGGNVAIYGGVVKTAGGWFYEEVGDGIGRGEGERSRGVLTLGDGLYLYGAQTANPENDITYNHIAQEDGDYARTPYMTVNSVLPHEHALVYSLAEDGVTITARCTTEGCELYDNPSSLTLAAPAETVETDDGETVKTDPVYDRTAKNARVVVDGRTDLWDEVVFSYKKWNPDTEAWEDLPKIIYTAESRDEETGELIETEYEFDGIPVDAGTYMAKASIQTGETGSVTASLEFTVRSRPVTVTAVNQTVLSLDRISEAYSKIRTGDGELLEGQEIIGFFLTPSPAEEGTTEGSLILSDVVIYEGLTDVTANYAITCVNGTFYVRENAASVTAAPAAKSDLVYDGYPQELVTAGAADGGTMQYALGTDEATAPFDGWGDEIPTGTGAGTYYVWYMAVGDDTHTDTEPAGPVAVTIGQRTAELTWSDTAFTFNQSAQAPTATVGNLASGTDWSDTCEVTVEGAQAMPGTYTATATKLSNANYALPAENTTEFTVEKYPAKIYFAVTSVSKQLGDAPFTNLLYNHWGGEESYVSDNPSVATVDARTGKITVVGIGEATITATVQDTDLCSYAVNTSSFTLTVTKATATIRYATRYLSRRYGSEPFVNPLTNSGDGTVRYSSYNTEIATVDETTGTVTIVGAGDVTIKAEVTDEGTSTYSRKTAAYELTVRKIDNPAIIAASARVQMGSTLSLSEIITGAVGDISYAISGKDLGCTVDAQGNFTPGTETGSVTVAVTVAGDQNYMKKTGRIIVQVIDRSLVSSPLAFSEITYGEDLADKIISGIVIPYGVTPGIHYSGTTRGGVAWDSDEAPVNAGSYLVTVSYEDNGTVHEGLIMATIQPKSLQGAAVNLGDALTYNGSEQTQTLASVTLEDTVIPASEYTVTANRQTDAGSYILTVTAKSTRNYTDSVTADFAIARADPAYTIPAGLTAASGDTLADVTLPSGWTWADSSRSVGETLGPQTFKANYIPMDTKNYNTVENVDVTVTVMAAAEFSQTPAVQENLVFNESRQELITAGTAVGGTVQYALSTDSATAFTKDWSADVPTGYTAGTYYVWYRIVGDEYYRDLDAQGPLTVTIGKAAGTVSFADPSIVKLYGDTAFTNELTFTGDGAVSYQSSDAAVAAVDAGTGEVAIVGAGEATITATVTDGENYSYAVKTAAYTLTVGMRDAVLQLPAFLTQIGEEAFAGISAVIVEVPENVTAIDARAFAGCENLRQITIPKNVRRVDNTALENCENVTVYGATGSEAQRFARANGFTFVDPDLP